MMGEGEEELDELAKKITAANLPDHAKTTAEKELKVYIG